LALAEAELPAEIIHYQHGNAESQWLTLSPNKTVPVLQHGDVTLYESAIMLEYIADVSGRLLPQTAGEKALPRLLHRYSDMTLGVGLRKVIFEKRDKPEADWNQQRIAEGTEDFFDALRFLADTLGDNDYFAAEYGFAECALTARLGLAQHYGIAIPEGHANLRDWFQRMQQRPSYSLTSPF
jgi:glutathione S-transferase